MIKGTVFEQRTGNARRRGKTARFATDAYSSVARRCATPASYSPFRILAPMHLTSMLAAASWSSISSRASRFRISLTDEQK